MSRSSPRSDFWRVVMALWREESFTSYPSSSLPQLFLQNPYTAKHFPLQKTFSHTVTYHSSPNSGYSVTLFTPCTSKFPCRNSSISCCLWSVAAALRLSRIAFLSRSSRILASLSLLDLIDWRIMTLKTRTKLTTNTTNVQKITLYPILVRDSALVKKSEKHIKW